MQRLYPDTLGRVLHNSLYQRMVNFCQTYTTEIPAEPMVHAWLQRFYNGDLNLIITVNLDTNYNITAHALIDIQAFNGIKLIMVNQVEYNKAQPDSYGSFLEYIDKLMIETGSSYICMFVNKNQKVLKERYGYTITRTYMSKPNPTIVVESVDGNVN